MLVLAAVAYVGVRYVSSSKGRYFVASTLLGGGAGRMQPVLEAALAEAATELNLNPPSLSCAADSGGTSLCTAAIQLTPGVSTVQANTVFTQRLVDLGLGLIRGTEAADGTVSLRYRASGKVTLGLELLPVAGGALDTVITPAPGMREVNVRARLALVVVDYGENRSLSRRFEALPGVFTAAVRSNLENAKQVAEDARQGGMEVILHLPMEPKNYPTRNPGKNAILVDLSGREIRKRVRDAVADVGPLTGVKTYMGGLAVEDRDVMRPVLEELHNRDLFFIESTQSGYSTVPELSRGIGVPLYETTSINEVDGNRSNAGTIGIRFDDLVRQCRTRGYAIGLIHAREPTLEVLSVRLPELAREGIVVMGLSEVMKVHALQ